MAQAGIDISRREFWEAGLKMIDDMVTQAETIWREAK